MRGNFTQELRKGYTWLWHLIGKHQTAPINWSCFFFFNSTVWRIGNQEIPKSELSQTTTLLCGWQLFDWLRSLENQLKDFTKLNIKKLQYRAFFFLLWAAVASAIILILPKISIKNKFRKNNKFDPRKILVVHLSKLFVDYQWIRRNIFCTTRWAFLLIFQKIVSYTWQKWA